MAARAEAGAEAAIARGIAGLPRVVSAHCRPDGRYWELAVSRGHGDGTGAMT